jgi:hypothetical protein
MCLTEHGSIWLAYEALEALVYYYMALGSKKFLGNALNFYDASFCDFVILLLFITPKMQSYFVPIYVQNEKQIRINDIVLELLETFG